MTAPKDPRDLIPGGAAAKLHRMGASNLSVVALAKGNSGRRSYEATARMGRGNHIKAYGTTAAEAVRALAEDIGGGGKRRAAARNAAQRESDERLQGAVDLLTAAGPMREIPPACSPENPCDEPNDLHVALFGRCYATPIEGATT